MATNFPSGLDAFTNPSSSDTLDNPPHDQQHADVNDAVEAIETALLDGAPLHIDDANERVGIGTTSPTYDLHVEGTGGFGGGTAAAAITTADTGNTAATLEFQADASAFDVTLFASGATPANAVYMNQRNNAPMVLMTNNAERMRIDSSGNVGINDTTPSYTLDVDGDINATGDLRIGGTAIGEWTSFTPTLANCTTTSIDAVYSKINKVVHVNCRLNIASVTGTVLITLPSTPSKIVIGWAEMSDASAASSYAGVVVQWSATQVFLRPYQTGGTYATWNANQNATVPFSWASGDVMRVVLTYVEA